MIKTKSLCSCLFIAILAQVSVFSQCPTYDHKDDVSIGSSNSLPLGYFIWGLSDTPGIYKSPIKNYCPTIIPGTEQYFPSTIQISDDGNWILFVTTNYQIFLITRDGKLKTQVPVIHLANEYPKYACFYRNSPYGTEICYLPSWYEMRSVKVNLSSSAPTFQTDRQLIWGDSNFIVAAAKSFAVVRDQVFMQLCPRNSAGVIFVRTGYLTIPDSGRGIGTVQDIFKWKNDTVSALQGCGHTMSHDGLLCLSNPMGIVTDCVPHNHTGFVITPFRRVTDSAITIFDNLMVYGTSINWCPLEFRAGLSQNMDFWDWYFGNNDDYVIGRLAGTGAPIQGIWLINWKTNTWTLLTPSSLMIDAVMPAVFFTDSLYAQKCDTLNDTTIDTSSECHLMMKAVEGVIYTLPLDTIVHRGDTLPINMVCMQGYAFKGWSIIQGDANIIDSTKDSTAVIVKQATILAANVDFNPLADPENPIYRVVKPNGGETFYVGKPCTVEVSSLRNGNAAIYLEIDAGRYRCLLPGLTAAANPRSDSIFIFNIPETIPAGSTDSVSTVSKICRILISDYVKAQKYFDESDSTFEIKSVSGKVISKSYSNPPKGFKIERRNNAGNSTFRILFTQPKNVTANVKINLYTSSGREIACLFDGRESPGNHQGNFSEGKSHLSKGLLICIMKVDGVVVQKRAFY